MADKQTPRCTCGHDRDLHTWVKCTAYAEPVPVLRPCPCSRYTANLSPGPPAPPSPRTAPSLDVAAFTEAERDDITLALRCWADDLSEPLDNPRSNLSRSRRRKATQVRDLADRVDMADLTDRVDMALAQAEAGIPLDTDAPLCAECGGVQCPTCGQGCIDAPEAHAASVQSSEAHL